MHKIWYSKRLTVQLVKVKLYKYCSLTLFLRTLIRSPLLRRASSLLVRSKEEGAQANFRSNAEFFTFCKGDY